MPDFEITALRSDISRIQTEVNELYKTVYKGNGSPSLVSQSIKLDQSIRNLEKNLDSKIETLEDTMKTRIVDITNLISEKFRHLEVQISHEFENKKMTVEGNWKFKVAVLSSITAIVASGIPFILNQFFHFIK